MGFGLVLQESEVQEEESKVPGKEEEKKAPAKKKVEKIKTREGKSVKLMELLDEAKSRAMKNFQDRQKDDEEGRVQI